MKLYEEAIALDPTNIVYYTNKAAVHYNTRDFPACIEVIDEALKVGKANRASFQMMAKAFTRKGNAYMSMEQYKLAAEAFTSAETEHHVDKTYKLKLLALKKQKEKEKSEYINPELAEAARKKGNEAFRAKKFPEAVKLYTEATKRNPESAAAFANRAAAYNKLGELKLSLADCDRCLAIDPTFVKALIRKGNLHKSMSEYNEALEAYEKVSQVDPSVDTTAMIADVKRSIAIQNHTGVSEEQRAKAMANPKIQAILSKPAIRNALNDIQNNPKYLQSYLTDPSIVKDLETLIASGILRVA